MDLRNQPALGRPIAAGVLAAAVLAGVGIAISSLPDAGAADADAAPTLPVTVAALPTTEDPAPGITDTSSTTAPSANVPTRTVARRAPRAVTPPPPNARFDYQIGGAYRPREGVRVVSRDREAAPAGGLYNICYVNAFQTQPGERDWWQEQHDDLLLRDGNGKYVVDEDWGETLLDISTPAKRKAIAAIVGSWITGCARNGYDAIEPDNIDSYERSEDLLTEADAAAFLDILADAAHGDGLAIAQKNAADLAEVGPDLGLDFAVVEECGHYDECDVFTAAYRNHVVDIEYEREHFLSACESVGKLISVVLRDLDVSAPGSEDYVYEEC